MIDNFSADPNAAARESSAIDRCKKCPEPKKLEFREWPFPNGLHLSTHCICCGSPDAECTSLVSGDFRALSPSVADRIIEWVATRPELEAMGVGYNIDLHGSCLELTFRLPAQEQVLAVIGSVDIRNFQGDAGTD